MKAKQQSYQLSRLPEVVKILDPKIDTWISQAVFREKNRRAINLQDVGLLFADLDTYKAEGLPKDPETQAEKLCQFCKAEGLPTPSVILFSGRGLQAKWLLTTVLKSENLMLWDEAQIALVKLLEPFASDMKAKDISRVLRLDHTVNTKSGLYCRVVYVTGGAENNPARYDFEALRKTLLEKRPPEVFKRPPKIQHVTETEFKVLRKAKRNLSGFTLKSLNWQRLCDIQRLWQIRGGVPEGFREVTLFWQLNFLLLSEPVNPDRLWYEAAELAKQISYREFYKSSDLSTLYQKAKDMRDGAKTVFHGREYPPLYTPRNDTLLNVFEITPDEEREMRTLISRQEHNRRNNERREQIRREAGAKTRAEYEAESLSRLKPWEAEGISRRWWYKKQGVHK